MTYTSVYSFTEVSLPKWYGVRKCTKDKLHFLIQVSALNLLQGMILTHDSMSRVNIILYILLVFMYNAGTKFTQPETEEFLVNILTINGAICRNLTLDPGRLSTHTWIITCITMYMYKVIVN
jgi:hypothetical protein